MRSFRAVCRRHRSPQQPEKQVGLMSSDAAVEKTQVDVVWQVQSRSCWGSMSADPAQHSCLACCLAAVIPCHAAFAVQVQRLGHLRAPDQYCSARAAFHIVSYGSSLSGLAELFNGCRASSWAGCWQRWRRAPLAASPSWAARTSGRTSGTT
jgi:hypothetical protein